VEVDDDTPLRYHGKIVMLDDYLISLTIPKIFEYYLLVY
jgi:hypothetical protein